MAKDIIFCADGTWNGPGKDLEGHMVDTDSTNVLKLYQWLSGSDTQESIKYAGEAERQLFDANGNLLQVAKYLDGVGYNDNWLVKALGGVFGAGVIARIVRGYTFISRNYEPGDRIFLVGFSRGAYTARSLAGLILDMGLLDARRDKLDDKQNAYRLGCAVWNQHREHFKTKPHHVNLLGEVEALLIDLPGFFSAAPRHAALLTEIPIQCVAVWDTVGALGIPQYEQRDVRIDAFQFCDNTLSPRVKRGLHAVSRDEQRADFTPALWDRAPNVVQALFGGAHADVGGGYPAAESRLSDVGLKWMQNQLKDDIKFGVRPDDLAPDPSAQGHKPWEDPPFKYLAKARRDFSARPDVDPNPA